MSGSVIAYRTVTFQIGGEVRAVDIRLFAPEQDAAGSWLCRYDMDWPDRPRQSHESGADAVEALLRACIAIGSELYTSDYHKEGQVVTEDGWVGYGFPVPNTLRDLLIGDDAEYL